MAATITWRVGTMECYPTYQQEKDVVFTVHWDCLGSETVSGSTYNSRVYGATGVTYHSGSDFTPYNQLTQDQVLNWVWESLGTDQKTNYENSVQTQINNQINPPVVILPLPWTPPSISQQPQNIAVVTGSSATFTVVASGPTDLSYQWIKNTAYTTSATVTGQNVIYSVSPPLPVGLSIASSTGVISGTPSVASENTTYTITASNSGCSINTSLQIVVLNEIPTAGLAYAGAPFTSLLAIAR